MPITLHCSCGKTLQVDEQYCGKKAKCPACGNVMLVEENQPETAVQAETPAEPDAPISDVEKPRTRAPIKRPEAAAKGGMLLWIVGGGCGLLAIVGCLILLPAGGLLYYSRAKAERARANEAEKERVVQKRRSEQFESIDNLKQIGLAMHNFHDANHGFPNHAILHPQTLQPLLSWRVTILPYIEEGPLYNQIRRDEPWDSNHNRQFWNRMPRIYQLPGKPGNEKTYYQVFHGDESAFPKSTRPPPHFSLAGDVRITGITDGTSNTIFAVEAADAVNWMKPEDIPFRMGQQRLDRLGNHWGDDTFHALMGDGVVRLMRRTMAPLTLEALITRNRGDIINDRDWKPNP